MVLASTPAIAHGSLASGAGHDDPTLGELLLTPMVVGIIHVVAMVALLVMAYRAKTAGQATSGKGEVPADARQVFDPYLKGEDELTHAFQPNRRMFIVSRNLPHFFVLTGLAAFFSVYTYQWLGGNTVYVYTTVHATAIVLLFAHSAMAWRNTWYAVSPRALYSSFGLVSPLAVTMRLADLEGVEVRRSRLKGMLDVSSLRLTFVSRRGRVEGRVGMTMRAIDAPDRIRDVILDAATGRAAGAT